jgi:aspartate/methionine/tyrosine aminotransferase
MVTMSVSQLINPHVKHLAASLIREVADAAMGRSDVLAFWFGEPHESTPEPICDAARQSISAGETFYSQNLGLPELREGLAVMLNTWHPDAASRITADRVAVTSAGVSGLMVAAQLMIAPGDRVLALTPVWPNLLQSVRLLGAQIQPLALEIDRSTQAWTLNLAKVIDALASRPKALVINSPNNPTGWVIAPHEMAAIVEACRRYRVWLLSDEAYTKLVFGPAARTNQGATAPSALDTAQPDDPVIVSSTFSKTWQMTGWRLGWLVVPNGLSDEVAKLVEFNTSCAPVFVQRAGLAALALGSAPIEAFRARLEQRREVLLSGLAAMPQVHCPRADGAMYAFFQVPGHTDCLSLARGLIDTVGLGLAPGAAFGEQSRGWLRWCYAKPSSILEDGLGRLQQGLRQLRAA